ncbi:MAG: SusC/RagA family TonB-linked outer membrane protein [Bacteroidales bacterium]|nr:SusC/RagA family TonB-linked outer membrane protein [Bacteroidales bacterium]
MVMLVLLLGVQAFAQNVITGKVLDSKGEPVPAAGVQVKGTNNGVVTDLDGNFSIKAGSGSVLVVSSIGYKTTSVTVGNQSNIVVTVEDDALLLDDVVVVAYGTARKKDLTGSLSAIQSETIAAQNTSSVSRMLEGTAPGLRVAATDGQPGMDMGIRVRGISSAKADAAAALVVIDGVAAQPAKADQNALENPLSRLNPEDIASVTILKDAASTALYGSRGANGVVLITTKAGQAGKARISFESRVGYNFVGPYKNNHIDNAKDYYEYAWRSIYNSYRYGAADGIPAVGTDGIPYTHYSNPNHSDSEAREFASAHLFDYVGSETAFQENKLGNWMAYSVPGAIYTNTGSGSNSSSTMSGAYLVNTDGKLNPSAKLLWDESYADLLMQTAFRQDYNISARGGTDKMHYYVSLGYLDEPSYLVASSFKRYSGRVNVDAMITDWLKVGANVSYANTNTRTMSTRWQNRGAGGTSSNTMYYINEYAPIISVYEYDADGKVVLDADGNKKFATGPTWSPLGADNKTCGTNFNRNLLWETETNKSTFHNQTWTPKVFAEVSLPKGFKFITNLTLEEYNTRNMRYMNHEAGRGASAGGIMIRKMSRSVLNTQQLLTWNREYDKHHVDAMIGHEYEDLHSELVQWGSAYELISGYTMPGNFTSRYSNITGYENDKWSLDDYRLESYLGRANYIYDEKYYLSASFRRDGSSKFYLPENRWGNFWSVGAGWRITSEPWMEDTKLWLDNAKIRTSYGVTGNQNGISGYYSNPYWTYGVSTWKSSTGGTGVADTYKLTSPGLINTDITWEHVHQFDLGVDFTLLNSRISGAVDYYNNLTTNSLFAQSVSPLANMANTTNTRNCAKVRNKGIEVELSSDIIRKKDFVWNVSVNFTHFSTILEDVPDSQLPAWDEKTSELPKGTWTSASETWAMTGGQNAGQGKLYLRGEGRDLYNIYLYKYAGVDKESGLPMYWHHVTYADVNANETTGAYAHGGRYKTYKVGDDVKTLVSADASQYELGSATPDIMGGLTSSLRWKNWDLSMVWAFQIGGKFFSRDHAEVMYRTGHFDAEWSNNDAWIASETIGNTFNETNESAYFPIQWWANGKACNYDGASIGSWQLTDMSLFNASYLRVKNITLGYTVPKKITDRAHISGLRAYVSADNLIFFSAKKGIDPSLSAIGGFDVANCVYPQMANVVFGVKLDF